MRHRVPKKAALITGIAAFLLILTVINFIPAFSLKTAHMSEIEGRWVKVFYEKEKEAAEDVFRLAEARAEELSELLDLKEARKINIYVYDHRRTMQRQKYGLIAPLLGLDWYIGDNVKANVLLTSPANPGKEHDYESVKNAVLHEMVHAYNYLLNPDMSYWLDNGIAGYLSGQTPEYPVYAYSEIPTFRQTRSDWLLTPIQFAGFGGYECSYTYVEYLDDAYGWESVMTLAKTGDSDAAFGKTEKEIYDEWLIFLKNNYSE